MESKEINDNFNKLLLNEPPQIQEQEEEKGEQIPDSGSGVQNQKIKIAMLGNVDAGKSTMVGILTSAPGQLDDGRGAMRANVFNYAHEIKNGRTSSVAHEIMGFSETGDQVIPDHQVKMKNKRWPAIVNNSSKIINFTDLCGHEKYLKTTMHGLTSSFPDYCMIMVGANMGVSKMTKEHIGVANALGLPMIVVFTKMDLAPEDVFQTNLTKMTKIMKTACSKVPVMVKTEEDIKKVIQTVGQGKVCPIFCVSSLTGEGIENLRTFLRDIPKPPFKSMIRGEEQKSDGEKSTPESEITTQFVVDSQFMTKAFGLILGGVVVKGTVKLNQELMFGPDKNGNFKPVIIKGIHEDRVPITEAGVSQSVCVNVKSKDPIKRNHIRKGVSLINPMKAKNFNPYHQVVCKYFDAQIKVLHHHTTIQEGY